MRILVAGASGFIGTAVTARLTDAGHEVVRLVRRQATADDEVAWSPASGIIDFTVMDRVDAVLNLSGASLARLPWTRRWEQEILESRVAATRTLAEAMQKAKAPPRIFLSGSAVGIYGDRPGEHLTDHSSAGDGFLAHVVRRWEEAATKLAPRETRTVLLRTGIIIGRGGAMQRVRALTALGVSGRLGTGGQHWPWISIDDEVGAIVHLLDSRLSGPVNLVGPTPATADRIMSALAERMHRPYGLPVPEKLLEFGLGRAADDLLLSSQKVRPQRLIDDGYRFRHVTVESAIDAMLSLEHAPAR
ncbi:TIGR01777 family oxidoreductase [Agromyces sp. ZXT2-6]|uniref:TIGR01777 family oxidoreductase n=1 Tax=Agromyces sp. ZXT2-6 TaxID=3461153 RepID=UPI0040553395